MHVIELIAYYCCCVIIDVGAHTQERNKGVCIGGKKTLDLRYVFLAETETEITNFLVVRKFKKIKKFNNDAGRKLNINSTISIGN